MSRLIRFPSGQTGRKKTRRWKCTYIGNITSLIDNLNGVVRSHNLEVDNRGKDKYYQSRSPPFTSYFWGKRWMINLLLLILISLSSPNLHSSFHSPPYNLLFLSFSSSQSLEKSDSGAGGAVSDFLQRERRSVSWEKRGRWGGGEVN